MSKSRYINQMHKINRFPIRSVLDHVGVEVYSLGMSLVYKPKFESMFEELHKREDIEVEKAILHPPASPQQLEAADAVFPLTPEMRKFYKECNGLSLAWQYCGAKQTVLDTGGHIRGCINIVSVENLFRPRERVQEDWYEENGLVGNMEDRVLFAGVGSGLQSIYPSGIGISLKRPGRSIVVRYPTAC